MESSEEPVLTTGQGRRVKRRKTYLKGKSRKIYRMSKDLSEPHEEASSIPGVCSTCIAPLSRVFEGFRRLKQQGSDLKGHL